jgi:Family of unknown function (DUF6882)
LATKSADGEAIFRDTVERAMEELQLKTAAHDGTWQLGQADWDIDQDAGEVYFTSPKGLLATCPVQIVGTFNTEESSWLWGWDHPSVAENLREHAQTVYEFGKKHGIAALTTRKLECSEEEAWEFAALACLLSEAQGAYCGPMDPTLVFITFGEVALSKAE